jgi:hypothetical protein
VFNNLTYGGAAWKDTQNRWIKVVTHSLTWAHLLWRVWLLVYGSNPYASSKENSKQVSSPATPTTNNEEDMKHDYKSTLERMKQARAWRDGCTVQQQDAVISALEIAERLQWQPIETAPKDGADILAIVAGCRTIIRWGKCSHVPLYGWIDISFADYNDLDFCDPECWMPLPKPPVLKECE